MLSVDPEERPTMHELVMVGHHILKFDEMSIVRKQQTLMSRASLPLMETKKERNKSQERRIPLSMRHGSQPQLLQCAARQIMGRNPVSNRNRAKIPSGMSAPRTFQSVPESNED